MSDGTKQKITAAWGGYSPHWTAPWKEHPMASTPASWSTPVTAPSPSSVRKFETGALRDTDEDKLDYEGFLCPFVLERFAEYMHQNRKTAVGLRDSDNWQKGIPLDAYMKSLWRHMHEVWKLHRVGPVDERQLEEALCAVLFNAQGYLHELLKQNRV